MASSHGLLLGIFIVALCKCSQAEWNTTGQAANVTITCNPHMNSSNCTGGSDIHKWSGHFSECSNEYADYCIHGTCRFVQEQNTPSCRCESGYRGARCEYLDFSWLVQENKTVLVAITIAVLVLLLLVIISICISVQRRTRRRKGRMNDENEVEKLKCNPDETVPTETSDLNIV